MTMNFSIIKLRKIYMKILNAVIAHKDFTWDE